MGTGLREFPQTPRGRGFSLLAFYSRFKYLRFSETELLEIFLESIKPSITATADGFF